MKRSVTIILCVIGIVFLFVSLPFIGIAYLFYTISANSINNTIQTNGTIVTTCNGSSDTTCHPIVSFRTKSGKKVQFSSNFSSSLMHQGDVVPVNYHPKDPQDAVISSFDSLWLFPVLLGSIGGFLLFVAVVFFLSALVFAFRRKRSRAPSSSTTPTVPSAPISPTALSDAMTPTAPSDAMIPTAPSVSKSLTALPDSSYPYHDPINYNPYRSNP